MQYEDERLTTVLAENALLEADMSRDGRKKKVDMVAATLILQSWLDRQSASETAADAEPAEDAADVMEFEDENGEVVRFSVVADLRRDGKRYLLMSETEEGGETFFLEETEDERGECSYRTVEDDALIEALYADYLRQCEEG